jgi:hypothetical protein
VGTAASHSTAAISAWASLLLTAARLTLSPSVGVIRSEGRNAAAERNYRRALKLHESMKYDADAARVSEALTVIEAEQSR